MSTALAQLLRIVEHLVPTGVIGDGTVAELHSLAARVRVGTETSSGVPIGLSDREGRPVHVGDTLSFDEREWGSPHEFTVRIEEGEIVLSGAPGDIDQYCTIVRSWND